MNINELIKIVETKIKNKIKIESIRDGVFVELQFVRGRKRGQLVLGVHGFGFFRIFRNLPQNLNFKIMFFF